MNKIEVKVDGVIVVSANMKSAPASLRAVADKLEEIEAKSLPREDNPDVD